MKNLVLIGLPGCGKSTVGARLAQQLCLPFVDLDRAVERTAGCTISALFTQGGEHAFRELEAQCLKKALQHGGQIIATGGGCVLREESRETLRRECTVFLDRPVERILATCRMEGRPLMAQRSLQELSAQRRALYLQCAEHRITADALDEIVAIAADYGRML